MGDRRQVKTQDAQKFAAAHGVYFFFMYLQMGFMETSAKQATNVDLMFNEAITNILKKGIKCPSKHIRLDNGVGNGSGHGKEPDKNGGCCQ